MGRESHAAGIDAAESTRNLVPQSPQKLLGAGFVAPQAAQRRTIAAPHCPQNFLCSGTSAAQFVQCIRTSTDINTVVTLRQKPRIRCELGHNSGWSVSKVPSRVNGGVQAR
jgi:hypothetical protein